MTDRNSRLPEELMSPVSPAAQTTVIRNLAWIVAWDAAAGEHVYRTNGDLAFRGDAIVHVGGRFDGAADAERDGSGLMAVPGLVNLHAHPFLETVYRGIREDHGVPEQYMSGLFERSMAYWPDDEGVTASAEAAYCELLQSGVTCVVDISYPYPGWTELIARSGLRGYLAPSFASARWHVEVPHRLDYVWDEAKAGRDFAAALVLIDAAIAHPCGRLSGVVSPAQIDTCSDDLLRDSAAAARARGIPLTVHAAQSVNEVQEMIRRHGKTSIQFAAGLGLLGPATIVGHGIFLDEHSWIRWHTRRDLGLLAEAKASVAHCPSPFARYGITLEDFGKYVRAGVNVGLGTDVAPHNLIEEMRLAAVLARVSGRDIRAADTAAVFHAATVGGADALGRPDLGRLAPGAKADIVLADVDHPLMMPLRDPLRSLVFSAAERAIRDVFIAGVQVVGAGRALTLDPLPALERLALAQQRMEAAAPGRDPRGRSSAEIAPLSLRKL
jgi:cytosine/adenosine deaminase-related metal-dependent hydrolase